MYALRSSVAARRATANQSVVLSAALSRWDGDDGVNRLGGYVRADRNERLTVRMKTSPAERAELTNLTRSERRPDVRRHGDGRR